MAQVEAVAKVKARVQMRGVKTHGPNSPDVLSGKVPLGFTEEVEFDEPEQTVELTYEQCVEMFGQERADELFRRDVHA